MKPELELRSATKTFESGVKALHNANFAAQKHELLTILGPSGCGKSTLLQTIAGLIELDQGSVHMHGRDVTRVAPHRRDLAIVFQENALLPHLSVYGNLEFPLKMQRIPHSERQVRVTEIARQLAIETLLDRRIETLSGGEQQRVALGRALVRQPSVCLLDEPLAHLDAPRRNALQQLLRDLHTARPATWLLVTHDQREAVTLGDRVAIMRAGRIEQVGTYDQLLAEPANAFVACFVGEPAINLIPGTISHDSGGEASKTQFQSPLGNWPMESGPRDDGPLENGSPGERSVADDSPDWIIPGTRVVAGIRPADLRLLPSDAADETQPADWLMGERRVRFPARVQRIVRHLTGFEITCQAAQPLRIWSTQPPLEGLNSRCTVEFSTRSVLYFDDTTESDGTPIGRNLLLSRDDECH